MLQIRLLGQFDIRLDGKRVTIPSRAGQSLLAYLVLTAGTSHRREKLAGTFWPDTTDDSARKHLRQELWRIRKSLPTGQPTERDFLIADEFTLKFNREAEYWLDVAQMEKPDLDLQSLISNLAFYKGELLPGFYDDWISLERERIQAVFDARMEQLLEQLITAERWIAVQELGERWLARSGAREPAYRALMLSNGARGDMAKVASLYKRCTDELIENLGVEPSGKTRALYEGLLKGEKKVRPTSSPPTGTITFLFTDIEGSTRLLDKMGDQYTIALSDHHEILRTSIQKWNGREMDTQGDSFFVAFTYAKDAVLCAVEAQRALIAHSWPQGESLRVRMGLHTGEPLIASIGYVGMDVHRAARIGDASHGGQILLSQTTRELVEQDLPKGMSILDLGEYRLKDMQFPTSIYQLVAEGLPAEFAPIITKLTGSEAPTPGEPPFKGLQFFDESDSHLFFGRETLTEKLVQRLQGENFLSIIIGASGSGKSSLVRAGVVPAIKKGVTYVNRASLQESSSHWQVHILTPTAHPLEALAIALTRDSKSVSTATTLVDDFSKDPRSLHFFLLRQNKTRDPSPPRHTLLVVDQFEELFTLCRDDFEREAFIDNLLAALTPIPLSLGEERKGEGYLTLIITLRADFYAHLAQYPELRDAVAHQQEYIGPMTTDELRLAIEEPAHHEHWEFEPGLVDLILRDVGDEPGALPLLSHALLETWNRRAGHMLTLKGYADAGGVRGAIAHTAESVYQNLSATERKIMQNILLRLTEIGEGTEDTRRRASFDELISYAENPENVRGVLNHLAQVRLITLGEDSAEVAHEALIREWSRLREWLDQDREGILLHRHLTESSHEWELLERDEGSLYRGARLAQANEWFTLNPNALNAQESMFLDASNNLARREEQEREEQRERELAAAKELAETQRQSASRLRIRNRVITGIGAIALILAIMVGMFGLRSNQNAINAKNNAATAQVAKDNALNAQAMAEAERLRTESEKKLAISRELAIASVDNLNVDPERSILLALEALKSNDTPEAENALHLAVQASREKLILHHTDFVEDVVYSPDGTRLATASDDGTVKIWSASTGQELLTLDTGPINSIAFNPADNGKLLVTAFYDTKDAAVWNTVTGQKVLTLSGHTAGINEIDYSPDGTRIATAGNDNTARIWDAASGTELLTLSDYSDVVISVAFNPDGTRLATSSNDGTVRVWDTATGENVFTLSGFEDTVFDVAFSPDGSTLAIQVGSTNTEETQLWDAITGQFIRVLASGQGLIYDITYNEDGSLLTSSGLDGNVRIWDTATGSEVLTLHGHASTVNRAAFSPDGSRLATSSDDGTARIWDITPEGGREWLTIAKQADSIWEADYSPDGTKIVTASWDGTTKVFNAKTGVELLTLLGHEGDVYSAAFSPDGNRIATSGKDNTAKIWDAITGEQLLTLSGHGDGILGGFFSGVMSVAYSPDGKQLATGGADGNVILWDANTGTQLDQFSNNGIGITKVGFTPDGKHLLIATDQPLAVTAVGEDATTQLWDLTTGKQVFVASQPVRIWGLDINNAGTRFATAGFGGIVRIRDMATGQAIFELSGLNSTVLGVAFSPDDSMLATSNRDGIILWDANTGKELLSLSDESSARGLAFSPDGTRLLTTRGDGTIHILLLKIDELIELAKSRLVRSLTTAECQQYLHMDSCPSQP